MPVMNRRDNCLYNRIMWSATILGAIMLTVTTLPAAEAVEDGRETFRPFFFAGESIDTFVADDFSSYLNADDASDNRTRFTGGLWTELRLNPIDDANGDERKWQVWLLTDLTYGVRSSDVDCAEKDPNKELAVCQDLDTSTLPDRTLFAIREATSLEGGLGVRLERAWWKGMTNIRWYLIARTSFVAVSEQPDDFQKINHVGAGIIGATKRFKGSYIEAGFVDNETYRDGETTRVRFDGRLRFPLTDEDKEGDGKLKGLLKNVQFFLRATVEVDRDDGPDSAITTLGFAYAPRNLFKKGS